MRQVRRAAARVRAIPPETALPLLALYFGLAALYLWQAWRKETPSLFTDELEMTQLSRSIADTGHPGRRGESYGFTTLVPWLTAPAWWLPDVSTAYGLIKYAQVLVMAGAAFPTYALARMIVSRPWALVAATGAIAAPALSYSSFLVEEPWGYPAAALAFWLLVRAAVTPTRASLAAAGAASVVAALLRSQLIAVVFVFVVMLLALAWRTERFRRFRVTWSKGDWLGAAMLTIGAVLFVMAVIGHLSNEWETVMASFKDRIVTYGARSFGAWATGVGFLPAIALLVVAVSGWRARRDPKLAAFWTVATAATAFVTFYAGLKGAYVSTTFSSVVVERNVIYLTPLAFCAFALVLSRLKPAWWAVTGATGAVVGLVVSVPEGLSYPYYEAHGLSILAFANRILKWPDATIETRMAIIAALTGFVLVALRSTRAAARFGRIAAAPLVVLVLAWNLTGEIYAAHGEHIAADAVSSLIPVDRSWIDEAVGDERVTLVGSFSKNTSPISFWATEFWNRSVTGMWNTNPAHFAPGPGRVQTPDLVSVDGTMRPSPDTAFALATLGVQLQGEAVAARALVDQPATLVRLPGKLRLADNVTGVEGDGWIVGNRDDEIPIARGAYNRFDVAQDGRGYASVKIQRQNFCPPAEKRDVPSTATVTIGTLGIGEDKQPAIASVTERRTIRVPVCEARGLLLRPPAGPWRVEVEIGTFSPREIDPVGFAGEDRLLGAVLSFGYQKLSR